MKPKPKEWRVWKVLGASWNLEFMGIVEARGDRSAITAAKKRWGVARYKVQLVPRRNPAVRRNAEERLRRLERAARSGQPGAQEAFENELARVGRNEDLEVEVLARLQVTPQERFFYEQIGQSYPAGSKPSIPQLIEFKVEAARQLARAEGAVAELPWNYVWEEDWDLPDEDLCGDNPCWVAMLQDADGNLLHSLGGIDLGDETPYGPRPQQPPYVRVIEAELALEARLRCHHARREFRGPYQWYCPDCISDLEPCEVCGGPGAEHWHNCLAYEGGVQVQENPPRALSKLRRAVGRGRECYPAAEALYHNAGGLRAGLTPMQQRHEGRSHWWVRGPEGEAWDPAAGQFQRPVPYSRGRGRGFLTRRPSRRARALARRAGVRLNPDVGMRELERRAAGGDPDAVLPLVRALQRAGQEIPLDLHARRFAIEHPGDHLVTYPNGKTRKVTNLGWLRRQLHTRGGMIGNMIPLRFIVRSVGASGECYLRVELDGDPLRGIRAVGRGQPIPGPSHTHTFETMFADCRHLWRYLQTPLFENEPLDWDGLVGVVDAKMHESTYGHPAGSEGGPDVECYQCGRRYWSGDPGAHPQQPMCPTCYGKIRHRFEPNPFPIVPIYPYPAPFYPRVPLPPGTLVPNPDEPARRHEREAFAGDVQDKARYLNERVRRGEVPMSHVALAAEWAGRRDAALLDPPPFDFQYLLADRQAFVLWAVRLYGMLPPQAGWSGSTWALPGMIQEWLEDGDVPPAVVVRRAPTTGRTSILYDAVRMIRARSNRTMHRIVLNVIKNYRISVYQRFMDELAGHHGDERLSPAWTLTDAQGPIVRKYDRVYGGPAALERPEEMRTVHYDSIRLRNASSRQATDLLGRILLREQ